MNLCKRESTLFRVANIGLVIASYALEMLTNAFKGQKGQDKAVAHIYLCYLYFIKINKLTIWCVGV